MVVLFVVEVSGWHTRWKMGPKREGEEGWDGVGSSHNAGRLLGAGMVTRVNTTGARCGSVWLHAEEANGQAKQRQSCVEVCGATAYGWSHAGANSTRCSVGVKRLDCFFFRDGN